MYGAGTGCGAAGDKAGSIGIRLDASLSSKIYGKSNTVQPPSQGVLVCIRYK